MRKPMFEDIRRNPLFIGSLFGTIMDLNSGERVIISRNPLFIGSLFGTRLGGRLGA